MKKYVSLLLLIPLSMSLAACSNPMTASETNISASELEEKTIDYVGLTVENAEILAKSNGVDFRVVQKDGEYLPATLDYRIGRINAAVDGEIVVSYDVEGKEKVSDYVGLTVEEAQNLAESNDVLFRVVMEDGEQKPTTRDFRIGRINATVESAIVVSYEVEGK